MQAPSTNDEPDQTGKQPTTCDWCGEDSTTEDHSSCLTKENLENLDSNQGQPPTTGTTPSVQTWVDPDSSTPLGDECQGMIHSARSHLDNGNYNKARQVCVKGWFALSGRIRLSGGVGTSQIAWASEIPTGQLPSMENPIWTVFMYLLYERKSNFDTHSERFASGQRADERERLLRLCQNSSEVLIGRLPPIFKRLREEESGKGVLSAEQQQEFEGF